MAIFGKKQKTESDQTNRIILPASHIFSIVHDTTIIYNGKIYKKGNDDLINIENNNFVQEADIKSSLIEFENILKIENKYRLDKNEEIKTYQRQVLEETKAQTDMSVNELENQIKFKKFIVGDLLPHFGIKNPKTIKETEITLSRGTNIIDDYFEGNNDAIEEEMNISFSKSKTHTLADILRAKSSKKNVKQSKNIFLKKQKVEHAPTVIKNVDGKSIFGKYVLDGKNIYINEGLVCTLFDEPYYDDHYAVINGVKLFPHPGLILKNGEEIFSRVELKEEYHEKLEEVLEREAYDMNPYKEKLIFVNKKLNKAMNSSALEKMGLSLEFQSDYDFYFVKQLNEFVLQETENDLHYFAPVRVGVHVSYRSGEISHGDVVVMDKYYPFPFLDSNQEKARLCTGDGRHLYNSSGMSDAQAIHLKLSIGEHTMYRGYHGSFTPYSHLYKPVYNSEHKHHKPISRKEVEKKGLIITNTRGN